MKLSPHDRTLAAVCLLLVGAALAGCQSAPTNPFAPPASIDKAAAENAATAAIADTPGSQGAMPAEGSVPARSLEVEASELARLGSGVAAAAVGLGKEVGAAAKSAASHVRLAAATTLDQQREEAERAAHHAVGTARQLAADAFSQAQRQAMDSLANMPLEQAGPILLLTIAEGGPQARRSAAEQLAARWPPAKNFPIDQAAESRETAVLALRALWAEQHGQLNQVVAAHAEEARRLIELTEDQAQEAQRLLTTLQQAELSQIAREQAAAALAELGPPLLPMLERRLAEGGALPAQLYSDVLPSIKPAFAALQRLQAAEVSERRAAAAELALQGAADVLPPLAVDRLAELIAHENDPAVWQSALVAVTSSAHQAGRQLAIQALENASAEVRREACRYLVVHGDPQHVPALVAVLEDPEPAVRLAAVRALGSVGTLTDSRPLLLLLDAKDELVRMEASLALARLRVAQGSAAVERLTMSTDSEVRRQAAQAMGEIADPLFLPALMVMLGDQPDVQQAAMLSLAQIAGHDVAAESEGEPLSTDERAARWRHWFAENGHATVRR